MTSIRNKVETPENKSTVTKCNNVNVQKTTQSTSSRNVEAGSGDTVAISSQGAQSQTQVQETRTIKELTDTIWVKLTAAGVDCDNLNDEFGKWLQDIGFTFDCGNLNDGTIDKEQYDAILSIIDKTIQNLKDSGKEMTFENLQAETHNQFAKDIFDKYGIDYSKKDEYTIRYRLGLSDDQEITEDVLTKWYETQAEEFKSKQNSLPENEKDAYKQKAIQEEAKELELVIAASSPEDNAKLISVIRYMFVNNRTETLKSIFKSMDQETRTKFANSITNEDLRQIILNPDAAGATMESKDATEESNIITQCQSYNVRQQRQYELSTDMQAMSADEKVQTALKKREAGEELTAEEKELLRTWNANTGIQVGAIRGTATSYVLNKDEKFTLLKTMDADVSQLPNYREIYSLVNQYECSNMSKEDFDKLMDEATNGNYSIVINDEKNGTTTQLNEPTGLTSAELAEKESKTANADYGYVLSEKPNNTSTIQALKEQIVSQQEDDNTKAEVSSTEDSKESDKTNTSDKQTIAKIKEKLRTNSNFEIMEYIFSLKDKNLLQKGIKIFEGLNEQIKELYLRDADSKTFAELAKHTKKTTLEEMVQGKRISNYYARHSAEKQLEDNDKNSIAQKKSSE